MTDTSGRASIPRSIFAVIVGFIVVIIISLGTDILLHYLAGFPRLGEVYSDRQFLWATIYRTIYGVVGSYITSALAPQKPMKHALIGGAIGLILNIAGAIATWNHVPSLGPHWYPVALMVGTLPTAWAGAKLRILQTSSQ